MTAPSTAPDKAKILLDTIESVWALHGEAALTVRRVVDPTPGITAQAVYTYFGSWEAAIDAMFRRAVDGVTRTHSEEVQGIGLAQIAAAGDIQRYVDYLVQHPARLRMMVLGHGPAVATSQSLSDARTRMARVCRSAARLGMLHGLIEAHLVDDVSAEHLGLGVEMLFPAEVTA